MSLQHLRTFLEVHRQQSLTEAARRLSLTQPAVSQQIASLEQQIGRRLFERTRRGVIPTAAANELYSALGSTLDQAEAILASAKVRTSAISGVVHLAGPAEYIGEQFVGALTRLTDAGVGLRIRLGGRAAIYDQLIAGDVDLAVTASPPDHRQLDSRVIAEERLLLVTNTETKLPATAQAMISEMPFCAYDVDLPLIREWCTANGLKLPQYPPLIAIPDLRTLLKFVAAGAGWSVLPDYLIADAIAGGLVQQAFGELTTPKNHLHLVWAKGSLRHPRVAKTKELLLTNASPTNRERA